MALFLLFLLVFCPDGSWHDASMQGDMAVIIIESLDRIQGICPQAEWVLSHSGSCSKLTNNYS